MSTKIIKFKDGSGNDYYSDMPTKTLNPTLASIVSNGYVRIVRAGRVNTIIINDLKVSSNVTSRTLIASGLPSGYNWFMFLTHTNQGSVIYPAFFFDGNGNLYLEGSSSIPITTGHRIIGIATYISK